MDFLQSPTEYYNVIERTATSRYFTLSAFALLVWDCITRFDVEIDCIWNREWRMAGKPLYLFFRYGGLAYQTYDLVQALGSWSEKFVYWILLPIGTAIFLFAVDVLLAWRLMLLYRMDRRLLIVNMTCFVAATGTTLGLAGKSLQHIRAISTPAYLSACWAQSSKVLDVSTIPPLVFTIWLLFLVSLKFWNTPRDDSSHPRGRIRELFTQDSVRWYIILSALAIWNVLTLGVTSVDLWSTALPFYRTFALIGGCRLVIYMRRQVYDHTDALPSDMTCSLSPAGEERHWCMEMAKRCGMPPPSAPMFSLWSETPHPRLASEDLQLEKIGCDLAINGPRTATTEDGASVLWFDHLSECYQDHMP